MKRILLVTSSIIVGYNWHRLKIATDYAKAHPDEMVEVKINLEPFIDTVKTTWVHAKNTWSNAENSVAFRDIVKKNKLEEPDN